MTKALNEPEEIKQLAQRHLTACEKIYAAATERNDIDTAAHVAKSALSVALNCAIDLGQESSRETAILWHKSLTALRTDDTHASGYLSRAVKWADGEMRIVYGTNKSDIKADIEGDE
jgi:hypothetical protein